MTTDVLSSSTSSWTAPAGVTSVSAECWGPGGGGWLAGGGAGAYARKNVVAVTPGQTYNAGTDFFIGLGGNVVRNGFGPSPQNDGTGATWFLTNTTVLADFGRGGADNPSDPTLPFHTGQGGLAANSIGDVCFDGGSTDYGSYSSSIPGYTNAASGGGGAGSAAGAGGQGVSNYTQPSGPQVPGNGGSSPSAGAGGLGATATGLIGAAGASNPLGGGGGGTNWNNGSGAETPGNPGAGGTPGGGGAGGYSDAAPGADGQISLTYSAAGSGVISGESDAAASNTGTLAGAGALSGASDAISSATGALTGTGALAGAADAIASTTGTLTGHGALTGASDAIASATGTLTGAGALAGASDAAASNTGTLLNASGAISGASSAFASASGIMTGAGALSGTSEAFASASGILGTGDLSGLAEAFASNTGLLLGAGALVGLSASQSTGTGTVVDFVNALFGTSSSFASNSGTLIDLGFRETVMRALFARLRTIPGFTSYSRRMTLPGVVPPGDMPALMQWEQPEMARIRTGFPEKRVWEAWVVLVFINQDQTIPGASIINPMLDAVELALAVDDFARNVCSLGGLVHYARIEGSIIKETGDTDSNGLGGAVIPIKIMPP
jgi:hypothetical protein